ncbi:hypothetical protein BZA77DRAFT_358744 [Pyronema omphalodes]|nr:hypothetical protein BZA77DRAFT_358744 [Pyronema omphalodes]
MDSITYASPPFISNAATLTADIVGHRNLNAHAATFIPAAATTANRSGRKPLNSRATVFLPAGTSPGYIRGPKRLKAEATVFSPIPAIRTDPASTSLSSALAPKLSPTAKVFVPRLRHQDSTDDIRNPPPGLEFTSPNLTPPNSPPQKCTLFATSLRSTRSF